MELYSSAGSFPQWEDIVELKTDGFENPVWNFSSAPALELSLSNGIEKRIHR